MNEQQPNRLSEAGEARREAMLGELVQAVDKTRRIRRTRRLVIASAAALGLFFILSQLQLPTGSPMDQSNRIVDQESAQPASSAKVAQNGIPNGAPTVANGQEVPVRKHDPSREAPRDPASVGITTIVQTDPAVGERFRAVPVRLVVHMDNAELERTLESIDRPARVLPTEEGLQLSAPVTDEELGLTGSQRGL